MSRRGRRGRTTFFYQSLYTPKTEDEIKLRRPVAPFDWRGLFWFLGIFAWLACLILGGGTLLFDTSITDPILFESPLMVGMTILGYLLFGLFLIAALVGMALYTNRIHKDYLKKMAAWKKEVAAIDANEKALRAEAECKRIKIRENNLLRWQSIMNEWVRSQGKAKHLAPIPVTSMSWQQLENFAFDVYRALGCEVELVGGSGDDGVDVRLVTPEGAVEFVQCKQWVNPVSPKELREFVGALHGRAKRGHFWSPSGFTKNAQDWAAEHQASGLLIIADDEAICRLVVIANQYGIDIAPH